jgi:hypothetical protein
MSEVQTPAPPTLRDELRETRLANRLRAERLRSGRLDYLERRDRRRNLREAVSIDWVTPYAELLDLTRRTGDPIFTGPSSFWQRREGRNWPIYQTEVELAILRAPARLLVATSTYTQGLINGLGSYVVGTGFKYRISNRRKDNPAPKELVSALQVVVDAILERNGWRDGEQPGLERELFERSIEDGECLLLSYPREDGWTDHRTAEPEQLTQPPTEDFPTYGFGVLTPKDDAQRILRYYFQYGETPVQGEEYEPEDVMHVKRNARRGMKRGMTDFCFNMYDNLNLGQRLLTNLGDSAAQQAAIVGVRQHESGSQQDVQSFVDSDADYTEFEAITGTQRDVKLRRRGDWEDIPKGMEYVPGPTAQSQPIHLQVLSGLTRGVAQRYNAPEWIASADASNNNYSSSLTAESPFVHTVKREQGRYTNSYRKPVVRALEHYVSIKGIHAAGRWWTWEEVWRLCDLLVTATSPETRNNLQEAQQAQTEIPLGVQSRQAYMEEQGRDVDQIEADNQEWNDKFGQGGQQLPIPPDQGGGGGQTDQGPPGLESLLESGEIDLEEYRDVVEAGSTHAVGDVWQVGTRWYTVKAVNGKNRTVQTKNPNAAAPASKSPKKSPEDAAKEKQAKTDVAAKAKKDKADLADKAKKDKAEKAKAERDARIQAKEKAGKDAAAAKVKVRADAHAMVMKVAGGQALTGDELKTLSSHLGQLTTPEIADIQKAFAEKGGKVKADKVAKIVAWAEGSGAKPAEVQTPAPPTPKADAVHKWPDHPTAHTLKASLDKSDVPPERKAEYSQAASEVLSRVPRTALDRAGQHLTGAQFYSDSKALGESVLGAELKKPDLMPEKRQAIEKTLDKVRTGKATVGGAYGRKTKELHLDGGQATSSPGAHSGHAYTTAEVYAHEWGHAIDGPGHELSSTPEWHAAYTAEIDKGAKSADGLPRLSKYAQTDTHEGWAEFSRLIYGGKVPLKQIEAEFPKCSQHWKDKGFWPKDAKESPQASPEPRKASEVGGAHLDDLEKVAKDISGRQIDVANIKTTAGINHPDQVAFEKEAEDASDQFKKLSLADKKELVKRLSGATPKNNLDAISRFRRHMTGIYQNIASQNA